MDNNTSTLGPAVVAALAVTLICVVAYLFAAPFIDGMVTYLGATVVPAITIPLTAIGGAFASLLGLG